MKRRTVIKDLIFVAGGFVLVPSCLPQPDKASIVFQHFTVTGEQEKLLRSVASAIIPATGTPGAGDIGCHLFALKMLDDCYEKEEQEKFLNGLDDVDRYAKTKFNRSFVKCTGEQQQQLLNEIEQQKEKNTATAVFYVLMKEKTIQGYLTSQYVLTNINKYEFIPAERYNGYAPVK